MGGEKLKSMNEEILGKGKTACSECKHFGNERRLTGKQNTCKKFQEVCCAVNNEGNCQYFERAKENER